MWCEADGEISNSNRTDFCIAPNSPKCIFTHGTVFNQMIDGLQLVLGKENSGSSIDHCIFFFGMPKSNWAMAYTCLTNYFESETRDEPWMRQEMGQ